MFGDYEPEDAWTITDTVVELVVNVRRRVAALDGGNVSQSETLEQTERRALTYVHAINRELTQRELTRAAELLEDVEQLRTRIRSGG
jgi:hypothetical protein